MNGKNKIVNLGCQLVILLIELMLFVIIKYLHYTYHVKKCWIKKIFKHENDTFQSEKRSLFVQLGLQRKHMQFQTSYQKLNPKRKSMAIKKFKHFYNEIFW
jgi:hypothetical protein